MVTELAELQVQLGCAQCYYADQSSLGKRPCCHCPSVPVIRHGICLARDTTSGKGLEKEEEMSEDRTKVFIAQCTEIDTGDGQFRTTLLGVYSTRELAEASFIRDEERIAPDGERWLSKHICYRGNHSIIPCTIDEFLPFGR